MELNKEYRIQVKSYMTKRSTPDFKFMEEWNHNSPMPDKIMTGKATRETKGMYYMTLTDDKGIPWTGWVIKSAIERATETGNISARIKVEISGKYTVIDLGDRMDVRERVVFLLNRFHVQDIKGNQLFVSVYDFDDVCTELEKIGIEVDRRDNGFFKRFLVKEDTEQDLPVPRISELTDTTLFPYQEEGVLYGLRRQHFILGDEMGLGG